MNELAKTLESLGLAELVLFLIMVVGYIGLLPRTVGYGSYGAVLGGKS